jgi:CheY-like chemotaxis protein
MSTILLIDDEESVRSLFQVALERAGYRVLTAENGKHGLRLLEHQEVDLILVDIFMPGMDGLELIPLLRETRPAKDYCDLWRIRSEELSRHGEALGRRRHAEEAVQSPRVVACGFISTEMRTPRLSSPIPT